MKSLLSLQSALSQGRLEEFIAHPRPMPLFAYSIAADQDRPSDGDGFVRAETIRLAVALVGHSDVNVYALPPDTAWPVKTRHDKGDGG